MMRLSKAARADLREIYLRGVEVFGSAQADMYIEGLLAALDLLADYPRLGQAEEELGPTARRHAYRSHVILYRTDGDADVRIQRIRHGREDWRKNLTGDDE